ncbi:MAG: D-2-hydroxyacid dehydrogenase, partial [Acidobacteriota bacterium]
WKVPAGALRHLPRLRWVQVSGAGVDHFLQREDLAPGVLLTRSLGRFGVQVAEYVVGYLLHHLLAVDRYRERQRQRLWEREERPLLADRTVGVIGLGSLGLPIARLLTAMGTRVVGVRRSPDAVDGIEETLPAANWRHLLPRCEALVLAAPRTSETVGMIDSAALAALPRGAVLVNVARGDLIDEAALLDALDSGHLGAAVLDVFTVEPLPRDNPLWRHPRAVITPHIAAPSEPELIADEFAENYRRFVAGRELINEVDRGRGY